MPGSGTAPSSHPATVSFDGSLGLLTGFTFASPKAGVVDTTTMESAVVGSGEGSRVSKDYECLSVDSGSASVRLLGCPPYATADIGTRSTLTIETTDGTYAVDAILESFEVEGSVGDLLRGAATFTVVGGAGS